MTACLALILALTGLPGGVLISATGPAYPQNAQGGATAVFAVSYDAGVVSYAAALAGEGPFAASARQAVSAWRFEPAASGTALVVVCYRRPELFAVGSPPVQVLSPRGSGPRLPFPTEVVEPAYPPDAIAAGSVVLHLEISADGAVRSADVVRRLGGLTQTSVEAVRRWRFAPAHDSRGRPVASEAYAVLVFRTPVIVPSQTRP